MSLSVVMPVYNEQGIVEVVVRSVHKNIISRVNGSEFIIVNDCSTDGTLNILKRLRKELGHIKIITPQKNGGHGNAIVLGFRHATKNWVFHTDSDNQFDPKEYWKLEKFKGGYDFILGYRKKRHDPAYRKFLSFMSRLTNFLLFGTFMKDTNSAFKLMNSKALGHVLDIIPESPTPTIMMTLAAKKLNYRIKTVGITHFPRKTGSAIRIGKVIQVCFRGVKDMLKLRIKTLTLPKSEFEKAERIKASVIS